MTRRRAGRQWISPEGDQLFQQPETKPPSSATDLQLARPHDPRRHPRTPPAWPRPNMVHREAVDGSSGSSPLLDLDPRKHEAVGRRYLEGRYGATPIISRCRIRPRRRADRRRRIGWRSQADRRGDRSSGPQLLRLLALVEGLRTEEDYLKHLWRPRREHVILVIDEFRGTSTVLVERAVPSRSAKLVDERKGDSWRASHQKKNVFDFDAKPGCRR